LVKEGMIEAGEDEGVTLVRPRVKVIEQRELKEG
jgi:hypothetical protein